MKDLIAISFMTNRTKKNQGRFHFKGAFMGAYLREIEIIGIDDYKIEKGEEYILHLKIISFEQKTGKLIAQILKARALDDLRGDL